MIASESQLAALAYELTGRKARLTEAERVLVSTEVIFPPKTLADYKRAIRNGADPLGEAFCTLRTPEKRRARGATYTPKSIVDAMISWAVDEGTEPARVVDPGAGSGRFILAAAEAFPSAILVAVEIDPLAALVLRANATVRKVKNRLQIVLADYRSFDLPHIDGPTLYLGNPPYIRHHQIRPRWKEWYSSSARELGFPASALAGLHVHFFLRTRQMAQPGDFGAFITAAEWLDVNYGSLLRKMLADGLGGTALHVIDPKAQPFTDALTTGAITCFRVGNRPSQFTVRAVDSLDDLLPLSAGQSVAWSDIEATPRWSALLREAPTLREGEIELGELFRVHRGQVTGCNAVWIAGPEARGLPERYLIPTITKARELLSAAPALHEASTLRRVIDLPVDLNELSPAERKAVESFLNWARTMKTHKGFIASHRRAWWSVGLRKPAPILCTYMARRAPVFVRNHAGARHINIAHGLYPVEPLSDAMLDDISRHLNETACISSGRTYAGGLVKFEPSEVSRLRIPDITSFGGVA